MRAPCRYLNARPLVFGLEQGLGAERIELSYDVPSVLATRLAAGELDLALLPVIELARIPDLSGRAGPRDRKLRGRAAPSCSCRRCHRPRCEAVALDPESRTINALVARPLRRSVGRASAMFVPGPRDLTLALARRTTPRSASATRRCSSRCPPGTTAYDLGGEAWTARTDAARSCSRSGPRGRGSSIASSTRSSTPRAARAPQRSP